jgi:uncharacterized protein YjdB
MTSTCFPTRVVLNDSYQNTFEGGECYILSPGIYYIGASSDAENSTGNYTLSVASESVVPVKVTDIKVTGAGNTGTVVYGNTLQMSIAVLPANATDPSVTWSVTPGTGTATISNLGLLTATGAGTVTVMATANDGSGIEGTEVINITSITIKGDANSDGKVTIMDAVKIARFLVGLETLTDIQKLEADYNGDNKVTIMDAQAIAKYLVSK